MSTIEHTVKQGEVTLRIKINKLWCAQPAAVTLLFIKNLLLPKRRAIHRLVIVFNSQHKSINSTKIVGWKKDVDIYLQNFAWVDTSL